MHVLKNIHYWLRPGGVALDLHPEPEKPVVEVIVGDYRTYLGQIDNASLIANIHHARNALGSFAREGWFVSDRSYIFEFVSHFANVDEWLRHREERRSTSVVDPSIVERARELLKADLRGELRVTEHVLATRLQRLYRPA